jgi:hypothetical protein
MLCANTRLALENLGLAEMPIQGRFEHRLRASNGLGNDTEILLSLGLPPRAKRLNPANYDAEKYKWRHLVENFFQRLKEFRGIAMRSCKTDSSFAAMIYLAATLLRTR